MKKPEKPEKPEISVIFPTYGRAGRLPGLLQALEGQTLSSDRFEVVVVDDCSTDGTAAVIEKLGPGLPSFLSGADVAVMVYSAMIRVRSASP